MRTCYLRAGHVRTRADLEASGCCAHSAAGLDYKVACSHCMYVSMSMRMWVECGVVGDRDRPMIIGCRDGVRSQARYVEGHPSVKLLAAVCLAGSCVWWVPAAAVMQVKSSLGEAFATVSTERRAPRAHARTPTTIHRRVAAGSRA